MGGLTCLHSAVHMLQGCWLHSFIGAAQTKGCTRAPEAQLPCLLTQVSVLRGDGQRRSGGGFLPEINIHAVLAVGHMHLICQQGDAAPQGHQLAGRHARQAGHRLCQLMPQYKLQGGRRRRSMLQGVDVSSHLCTAGRELAPTGRLEALPAHAGASAAVGGQL